jgi:hypothetical protein
MRVRGGGAVTDGVCGCLGGGLMGFMLRGGGRYEGDLRNGKLHGRGIYTFANGEFAGDR